VAYASNGGSSQAIASDRPRLAATVHSGAPPSLPAGPILIASVSKDTDRILDSRVAHVGSVKQRSTKFNRHYLPKEYGCSGLMMGRCAGRSESTYLIGGKGGNGNGGLLASHRPGAGLSSTHAFARPWHVPDATLPTVNPEEPKIFRGDYELEGLLLDSLVYTTSQARPWKASDPKSAPLEGY
jgi:hypothetical protein